MASIPDTLALAFRYHQAGHHSQAEELYRQVLLADPHQADTHHLLGVLAYQTGRHQQAILSIQRALTVNPGRSDFHCSLGLAYEAAGQTDQAALHFQQAVSLKPDYAEGHNCLGNAWFQLGKLNDANRCYQQAIALKPEFADAHYNLGNVFQRQDRLDDAVLCYREAVKLKPGFVEARNNLGNTLRRQEKLEEAKNCYREALRLKPDLAEAHYNLGLIFESQGLLDDALRCYDETLRLSPGFALAHGNRAVLLLLRGDFEQGWAEYEWRLHQPGASPRPFTQPRWDGAHLGSRTILLHGEQGLGDTIQFIRYAALVKARAAKVIVACQPALLELLCRVPGVDQCVALDSELPPFDVEAPLPSLPGIFHTILASIPADVPYLQARPDLVEHWRQQLEEREAWSVERGAYESEGDYRDARADGHGPESSRSTAHAPRSTPFRVGIAWQGNPTFRDDCKRSIPLRHFVHLVEVPGVQLISLQKGWGVEQMRDAASQFPLLDLSNRLDEAAGPFMDTAAIMKNVDLVICSDTVTAHLAGALGVKVWVVLRKVPDWRWLLGRDDSPWYPTMRLFRQEQAENWDEVFVRIANELQAVYRLRVRA